MNEQPRIIWKCLLHQRENKTNIKKEKKFHEELELMQNLEEKKTHKLHN